MSEMRDKVIFKIIAPEAWRAAAEAGVYHGSDHDKEDGYLHFSTASQLEETLKRYYPNRMAVTIAAVASGPLGDALKYEHSASRGEEFPHLYGPLPLIFEPPGSATIVATFLTHVATPMSQHLTEWIKWMSMGGAPEDDPWAMPEFKQP